MVSVLFGFEPRSKKLLIIIIPALQHLSSSLVVLEVWRHAFVGDMFLDVEVFWVVSIHPRMLLWLVGSEG